MFTKVINFKYMLRIIKTDTAKFGTAVSTKDSKSPLENVKVIKKSAKVSRSSELAAYIDSQKDSYDISNLMSTFALKIHRGIPVYLYLVSKSTAKSIVELIGDQLKGDHLIVEVNPGFGCLTRELVHYGIKNIRLCESSPLQKPVLEKLGQEFPDLQISYGDFFGIWRIEHQDKADGGNRLETFFDGMNCNVPEVTTKVLGAISSLNFIRYLIRSIVFQRNIFKLGKSEFFLTLPPSCYYSLVPFNSEEENKLYRQLPVLFDMLCDVELIAKVPRKDFMPWQTDKSLQTKTKRMKWIAYDQKYLFLVHIKLKPNLPCKPEELPLMWYFFKLHLHSKQNRIIPMLEQWIPGCGIWLITGQDPPGTIPLEDQNASFPRITIFTMFSDLSNNEKLLVFKKFISWPEFKHCSFQESLDSYIVKSSPLSEDNEKNIEQDEEADT